MRVDWPEEEEKQTGEGIEGVEGDAYKVGE